ncbi:UNVERIFIED_CONTAM: putative receptor-like protein kinase [Sesamum latifolium]|uniref:Receptor-like protein kinase n=1 Tax=Sesamum latifolium TaxID=2727402 RepID=A0AAW2UJW9_9LAMI
MHLYPVSLALLFIGLITFTAASNNPTHSRGSVSINCGSTGSSAARDGREWLGDVQPKLSSLLQMKGSSTTSSAIHNLISADDPVPHKTARLSRSRFSYAFQVNPGQKVIRLHLIQLNTKASKATRNFSDAHLIGKGGFGKVYKGLIDNGRETVAIKRQKSNSKQGAREFLTEIETLTELRHVNLVSLIGYCNEHGEMILVYEYMASGTLADHLYKLARKSDNSSSLAWKQRLNICIGAGRGLDYLHTGHSLIHRDVKASNILLDENFIAKVSDFGLAKPLSRSRLESHISTKVKGTFGYFDPNYLTTDKLTRKSDTYAFGVVLLEVLSGRPAVDPSVPMDEQILTKWARENISKGKAVRIVDSNLRGEISQDSLKAFVGVAERCLHDEPKKRPTMAEVVLQLEFALEQQGSSKPSVTNGITTEFDYFHSSDYETNFPVGTEITSDVFDIHSADYKTNFTGITSDVFEVHSSDYASISTVSKVVNPEPLSRRKDGVKATTHKPLRIWPWGAFWNRVKPSDYHATGTMQKFKETFNMPTAAVPAIPLDELKDITDNFGLKCSLGEGMYGSVYHGVLKSGQAAAIKKLDSRDQPDQEFLAKVSLESSIKHENLVQLLGYCVDGGLHVLAYEYAPNGSLYDVLHAEGEIVVFFNLAAENRLRNSFRGAFVGSVELIGAGEEVMAVGAMVKLCMRGAGLFMSTGRSARWRVKRPRRRRRGDTCWSSEFTLRFCSLHSVISVS